LEKKEGQRLAGTLAAVPELGKKTAAVGEEEDGEHRRELDDLRRIPPRKPDVGKIACEIQVKHSVVLLHSCY
jgi:hypothetical protein